MTANSQEASVSSTESADITVETRPTSLLSQSFPFTDKQLSAINSFPWMAEFYRLCHKDMINPTGRGLEKLMNFYLDNVTPSVKESITRPIRGAKLKSIMGDVLMFFHMSYTDNKPPFEHSSYLAKMSDLMALYMDLEIKASRSGAESLPRVASKITSCLNCFFGNSYDYILDTVFKTKQITKNTWEISDLIFRRVLRECPGSSSYVMTFIRYILAYKLWKAIMSSGEEKKRIQFVAERHVKLPPLLREKISSCASLRDILPRIPKAKTDIVKFLLEAKYVAQDKIKMFLKAAADPKIQCALDRHNLTPLNNSFSFEKEDNDNILLMNDWSNISIESDIGDSLLLNKIIYGSDNKKLHKLKNGLRSYGKTEIKKKKKKIEISLEEIGEDDKETSIDAAENNTISAIKPKGEETIKKDQINQVDSVCEGDTMEVAAEVELPSSPTEPTDFPTIKLEPQSCQTKENVIYPWGISNIQSYYGHNGYDYGFDAKSEEYIEKPENASLAIFGLLNNHKIDSNKGQAYKTYSSIGDNCPPQRLGVIPSEVMIGTKSIDALRAQGILYNKCFPSEEIIIPIVEHNVQDQSEEIPLGVNDEALLLEEHSEETSVEELDVVNVNPRSFVVHNKAKSLGECIKERTSKIGDVERSLELKIEIPPGSDETPAGVLHEYTTVSDNRVFEFLNLEFKQHTAKFGKRTMISLLYPLFSERKIKEPNKELRCHCGKCTDNFNLIRTRWKSAVYFLSKLPDENGLYSDDLDKNILKAMANSLRVVCDDFKLLHSSDIDEVFKEESEHSNLPLKKRKAFPFNSFVKDERSEMSYPNTPMISIAEVELAKEKFRFDAMTMNHPSTCNVPPPPINYMPDYITHPSFPNPADIKYDNVMVQSNIANIPPDQNPVPGAFTTTFIPEHQEQNRPKFKTPAQLKEFQHLSAAEDLLNFSLSPRSYCNENQEPRSDENEGEKRKTRQKTKSSRKRKRTT